MTDPTDDEFLSDFGDSLDDAALTMLLERARATGDREVRLLVKQYRTLRTTTRSLLGELSSGRSLEAVREGDAARFARFVVSDGPHPT